MDDSGVIRSTYVYDAYGNTTSAGEFSENSFGYTGREWDKETGLLYLRNRYYDPMEGRFISRDPIAISGNMYNNVYNLTFDQYVSAVVNPYAYVQNNPINLIDPTGLLGIGVNGGGTAEAGIATGGAAQANSGVGVFVGSGVRPSIGGYTASGGFVGDKNLNDKNFTFGATAGLGAGAFLTNANSAQQLLGPFDTWTLNVPLFSVQFATDGSTWMGSISAGKSWGFSFSRYPVTTTTASGGCK